MEWTEWVTADAVQVRVPNFAFPAAVEEAKRNFSTEVGKGKGKAGQLVMQDNQSWKMVLWRGLLQGCRHLVLHLTVL